MADPLAQYYTALEHARITHYVAVGAVAIWVCDYLYNLPQEVEHIWFSKRTPVKVIYIFSRMWAVSTYTITLWFVLTDTHSAYTCKVFTIVTSMAGSLNAMLAELMIYLHIHAFSHKNPIVGGYLAFQYVALFTTCNTLMGILCSRLIFTQPAMPGLGCISDTNPEDIVGAVFIAPVISEFMVVLIAMLIVFQKYRGLKSAILNAFLRDGLIYPLGLLIMSCTTIVVSYKTPNTPLKNLFGVPIAVFHNVATARLILHLRYVSKKNSESGTTRQEVPTIRFASNANPTSTSRSYATWTTGWSGSYANRETETIVM